MAKLYFRYGTVGSAKTLNLLAVAHNYKSQSKNILLVKPELDTRFGETTITSRAGLEMQADVLLNGQNELTSDDLDGVHCLLVDEVQFLKARHIDQFRWVATYLGIPVICYGLRTDFRGKLFEGSQRILELADSIEEIKTTCNYCGKKAIFNLKMKGGRPSTDGPTVDLGAEEKYLPACARCYNEKLKQDISAKLGSRSSPATQNVWKSLSHESHLPHPPQP